MMSDAFIVMVTNAVVTPLMKFIDFANLLRLFKVYKITRNPSECRLTQYTANRLSSLIPYYFNKKIINATYQNISGT